MSITAMIVTEDDAATGAPSRATPTEATDIVAATMAPNQNMKNTAMHQALAGWAV